MYPFYILLLRVLTQPTAPTPGPVSNHREVNLLGGSWVVISRVISPLIWVITIVILLITPHITTHEPPSRIQLGENMRKRLYPGSYTSPVAEKTYLSSVLFLR